MENETIAKLISTSDAITLFAGLILAAVGVVVLFRARPGGGRVGGSFARVLCITALVAFLPELTYFNYPSYLRFFAGKEITTVGVENIDPQNRWQIRLTNGGAAVLSQTDGTTKLQFNKLNEVVTSIYIETIQDPNDVIAAQITWRDEEGRPNTFERRLSKGLPQSYYIHLQPRGKVSELEISFFRRAVDSRVDNGLHINHITLNKPIPFYISGARLIVFTLIMFVIFAAINKDTRTKISNFLFKYKFDAANKKQKRIYVATVAALLVVSWFSVYTSLSVKEWAKLPEHNIYNVYLVDALIAGRTWLDYGNPEKLLGWERPYDSHWRTASGKVRNQDWMWEWSWYEGKYYSYFGIVPAVILHVPYKLITGGYLSPHASIFIFSAIAIVMLALLWRYCVIKWMPNATFAFFMLGILTLYFTSNLHTLFVFTRHHSIVQAAGLMFAIAGIYLLLKSIDKAQINHKLLFFACLCFALIAGCRPNIFFVSLLVPILLWKRRTWKLAAYIVLPYIIVAIPLMWYNYIRFESVTEFGGLYVFTNGNNMSSGLLNPIAKIIATFVNFGEYLLLPASYSLSFPFVEAIMPRELPEVMHNMLRIPHEKYGLINFPIILCLLFMLKKSFRKDAFQENFMPLFYGLLVVAIVVIFITASVHPTHSRYVSDFAVFMILPSLFCAYCFCCEKNIDLSEKMRMKIVYMLMGISITIGALIAVTGGINDSTPGRNMLLLEYLGISLKELELAI